MTESVSPCADNGNNNGNTYLSSGSGSSGLGASTTVSPTPTPTLAAANALGSNSLTLPGMLMRIERRHALHPVCRLGCSFLLLLRAWLQYIATRR